MGRFRNIATGVVVSVDDAKNDRYVNGWEPADKPAPEKPAPKQSASKK